MSQNSLTPEQQQLVMDNLVYAEATAKKFLYKAAKFINREDAICEGIQGLCVAAQRFNPNKGVKFTTFSYFYIFKYVYKYIEKESKSLYGSTSIRNRTQVLCSLESIPETSRTNSLPYSDIFNEFNIQDIFEVLDVKEGQILLYFLSGYTKREICNHLHITTVEYNSIMLEIKRVIAEELNREDLMEEKQVTQTVEENKKKRGRPKKVALEISKSGAESYKETIEQVTIKQEKDEDSNIKENTSSFINNYNIQYNVGESIYIAVFTGESGIQQYSLTTTYKYRCVQTTISSIVLKSDFGVYYTTPYTKKAYVDSSKVFKDKKSCEEFCKKLNKE